MYNENDERTNNLGNEEEQNSYHYSYQRPVEATSYKVVEQEPKKKKTHGTAVKIVALCLSCALIGGVGSGAAVTYFLNNASQTGATSSNTSTLSSSGQTSSGTNASATTTSHSSSSSSGTIATTTDSSGTEYTASEIYNNYCNAIVGISTESTTTNVFGQTATTASSGSGFIISSDGYIITNCHVIADSNTVKVTLFDETSYDATIVGSDSENDVALLKIDATGLSTVPIGNSDNLSVGESVVAIGNPLGELTYTLTVGVVSALDREINIDGTPINMLQTDAAINPGNSGGPLFDMEGNVIGITTAKYSDDEIEGLGFAIPINDVMAIVTQLKTNGYVTGRAYFGISVEDITTTVASYYGLPQGVYVAAVESGSCAETAGLKVGDIITALGDQTVTSMTELMSAKKDYSAGDTTTVTVYRDGASTTLTVTFDEQQPETTTNSVDSSNSSSSSSDSSSSGDSTQNGDSWFGSENPFSQFGSSGYSSGSYSTSGDWE